MTEAALALLSAADLALLTIDTETSSTPLPLLVAPVVPSQPALGARRQHYNGSRGRFNLASRRAKAPTASLFLRPFSSPQLHEMSRASPNTPTAPLHPSSQYISIQSGNGGGALGLDPGSAVPRQSGLSASRPEQGSDPASVFQGIPGNGMDNQSLLLQVLSGVNDMQREVSSIFLQTLSA